MLLVAPIKVRVLGDIPNLGAAGRFSSFAASRDPLFRGGCMRKTTYYCDSCGVQKQDSNRWWTTREDDEGWTLSPFHNGVGQKVYCGQQCAMKSLAEYMHEQTQNKEVSVAAVPDRI
jgi:hypothetical protein